MRQQVFRRPYRRDHRYRPQPSGSQLNTAELMNSNGRNHPRAPFYWCPCFVLEVIGVARNMSWLPRSRVLGYWEEGTSAAIQARRRSVSAGEASAG